MTHLSYDIDSRVSYSSQGLSGSIEAEPVIVTPCRASSEFGCAAIRDRVFATRCEFSWRSEKVSTPSGDGRSMVVFKRLKQTAGFERESLHGQVPRAGDRVTRTWDGVTFEIAAVYPQSSRILCDLVVIASQLQ